jgi:hypothetical protein
MSETKVSEPKQEGAHKVRKVRRSRKNYGEIRYYPGKVTVYWANRRTDQYHRLIGGWLVEADTIAAVKLYGVTHVGLRIEDGTLLLTPISTFSQVGLDKGAQRMRSNTYVDEWGNRGAVCWHIPMALWVKKEPDEDIKHAYMLEQMHIKRGRSRK